VSDSRERSKIRRRKFLALVPQACAGVVLIPLLDRYHSPAFAQTYKTSTGLVKNCWLDLCAPFVVQDAAAGIDSEIFLTSDTFIGKQGYQDSTNVTEYEIYLYDSAGQPIGQEGVAKRLTVPAMHTTVLKLSDLIAERATFWGGMKIRLRPQSREPMYASDLFSSAFVRWKTDKSFDNVHANPDPLQWQRKDSFFYSMPFPSLETYESIFSLFNPNTEHSAGTITLYSPLGEKFKEIAYDLKPRASLLVDLTRGELTANPRPAFVSVKSHHGAPHGSWAPNGGSLAVTNDPGSTKSFGYLLIKRSGAARFSVEHPIHQPPYKLSPAPAPIDPAGKFKAKNILYTPLVFQAREIGGLTLQSRFHFSSGAPIEEFLWLKPFITDASGNLVWQISPETPLPASIAPKQIQHDAIKLGGMQSCIFDPTQLNLPKTFSGGLFLAVAPTTNHTLMKVELLAKEWSAHAFTHFRPGLAAARSYQSPAQRGALATDYIACGARVETASGKMLRDEVIGIVNIDDKGLPGHPALEVFCASGLITSVDLGALPAFGCRHYLLSEILSGKIGALDLSLRLVDEQATLLMSVIHLDYVRRDVAMDHGSDRFSTFVDYPCAAEK
jgi:hypothetical protein